MIKNISNLGDAALYCDFGTEVNKDINSKVIRYFKSIQKQNIDGINNLNILKELNDQGKTVIMITHNQEHANMFKKVIELVDGKIVKNEKKKTKN